MSNNTRLYTEMVVTGAILHGYQERFLGFSSEEHPVAIQLGGSDPSDLAECAYIAEQWGYDEINLNCGCPSDRVQKGKIGAVLMQEPKLVAECMEAMQARCSIPVTIKHRIGIDDQNDYDDMARFVDCVAQTGCSVFIVHARKAWLKGLSPKENREVPPLNYESVARLKRDFPELTIVVNGGITDLGQANTLLSDLDGVMIGREAYSNPYLLAHVDQQLFGDGDNSVASRIAIAERYTEYCKEQVNKGTRLHHMSRHVLGLFAGQAGGKLFRRHISENAHKEHADHQVILDALDYVRNSAKNK